MTGCDVVEVSVSAAAPPDIVFRYFTDPDRHVEWMGRAATLNPVCGGVYRLAYGDGFAVSGAYLHVDPPRCLAFSWGWAHDVTAPAGHGDSVLEAAALPPGSTRVAVTFDDEDGGTRVTLRHDDLPTAQLIEGHRVAWQTYLDRLRIRVAGANPGPDPHG
jgi:uncharacterized protein YndB with AHSA1/START domain